MSERTIPPVAPKPPTREQVERCATPLRPGGSRKADLRALEHEGRSLVVKDFSGKSAWRRLLGRLQVARELRAYHQAGALEELPRLIGRVDAHAFAIERIEGVLLAKSEDRFRRAELHLRRLDRFLAKLHGRGIAHLDLRGKSNVLLDRQGRLRVVDLGAALRLRPGGLAHRLLFRWLAVSDRTGLLKWKARLAPDLLTADEEALLTRYRLLRRLWVLNRRHARPAPARPGGSGVASRLPGRRENDRHGRGEVTGR